MELVISSNIKTYLENRIIDDIPITESKIQSIVRKSLKTIGFLLGSGGNIPFIKVNYAAGGGNRTLGALLVYGNATSSTSVIVWAVNDLIDSYLSPRSEEEKKFTQIRKIHCCGQTIIFTAAVVIGMSAQFPLAYFGYQANVGGVFPAPLMPVATMLSDGWLSVCSSKWSIDEIIARKKLIDFEKKLAKMRDAMISFIEENQKILSGSDREKALTYAHKLQAIREQSGDRALSYIEAITEERSAPAEENRYWGIATTAIGTCIATPQILILGYISYLGMDAIAGNTEANIIAATITVAANTYLAGGAIVSTAKRVCNAVKELFFCRYEKNLNEQLTPRLTALLKALVIGTAALSYGASWEMTASFDDINEDLRIYLGITFSVGSFLFFLTAMFDIADQIATFSIKRYGDENARLLVEAHEKMQQFTALLQRSPLIEYARFHRLLPQPLLHRLQQQALDLSDELSTLIASHPELDAYLASLPSPEEDVPLLEIMQ